MPMLPTPRTALAPRDGWPARNEDVAQRRNKASWQAWCDEVAQELGRSICGARAGAKRDPSGGYPCKQRPATERDRCRLHGGRSKRGPAHPAFIDGRKSRDYVPDKLRHDYERALADPDLISTRRQIAMLDARGAELLRQLGRLEKREAWAAVVTHFDALERARAAGKREELETALDGLREAVNEGATESQIWAELRSIDESRRRLAETERKRLEVMRQFVSADRVMATFAAVARLIAQHVTDPAERDAVADGLRGLIGAAGQR